MSLNIPLIMIRCLLCTIFIELAFAFIVGIRNKKDFINVILVNCITNPIVVIVPLYFNLKYGLYERRIALIVLELLTLFTEGLIYKKVSLCKGKCKFSKGLEEVLYLPVII